MYRRTLDQGWMIVVVMVMGVYDGAVKMTMEGQGDGRKRGEVVSAKRRKKWQIRKVGQSQKFKLTTLSHNM